MLDFLLWLFRQWTLLVRKEFDINKYNKLSRTNIEIFFLHDNKNVIVHHSIFLWVAMFLEMAY